MHDYYPRLKEIERNEKVARICGLISGGLILSIAAIAYLA